MVLEGIAVATCAHEPLAAHLSGGQPQGEGPCIVLNQDAKEAFYAAEDGAVDHDGPLLVRVLVNVRHVKPAAGWATSNSGLRQAIKEPWAHNGSTCWDPLFRPSY